MSKERQGYSIISTGDDRIILQDGKSAKLLFPEHAESNFLAELSLIQRVRALRNGAYGFFALGGTALVAEGMLNNPSADTLAGAAVLVSTLTVFNRNNSIDALEIESREMALEDIADLQ